MDKRSLETQFMLQTVVGFAKSRQTTTDLVPAFKTGITQVNSFINSVTALSGLQSQTIGGSGATKDFQRSLVNSISADTMASVRSWAISVNNDFLAAQLNFSLSKIKAISDKNIASRAAAWIALIQPHIADLVNWDVTASTITSWQTALADYSEVYQFPKEQLESRKAKTKAVKQILSQASQYCRNILDGAAVAFKSNGNLDFFNLYKSYRKITPVATLHGKFRVLVTDELNKPLNNVQLTQAGTDNSVSTDIDGQASLDIIYNKNVPKSQMNVYNFILSNKENEIETGPVVIKHNQTVSKAYIMAPSGFIIPESTPAHLTEKVLVTK